MLNNDSMKRLSTMAAVLQAVKDNIAVLEEQLMLKMKMQTSIETEDIPQLMKELDMKSFTLSDGTKIEVRDDLSCNISQENRDGAHQWLRDNNFGGIIKTIVSQQYGAGEIEEAMKNAEAISKLTGREASILENVHTGTLKAFLKEQRAKGTQIPEKLFGLYPFSRAKITPPPKVTALRPDNRSASKEG